jgi:hypothetical protein
MKSTGSAGNCVTTIDILYAPHLHSALLFGVSMLLECCRVCVLLLFFSTAHSLQKFCQMALSRCVTQLDMYANMQTTAF